MSRSLASRAWRSAGLLLPLAVAAAVAAPASSAVAGPIEPITMDQRCLQGFAGTYPASQELMLTAATETVTMRFPDLVIDYSDGLVGGELLTLTLSSETGTFDVRPTAYRRDSIDFPVPPTLRAIPSTGVGVISMHLSTFLASRICSYSSDASHVYGFTVDAALQVVAGDSTTSMLDLQAAPSTSTSYITEDATTQGPRSARWGDTVVIQNHSGYFTAGPEGLWTESTARAGLLTEPRGAEASVAPPLISADGSTAIVRLPSGPPSDWDEDWWRAAVLYVFVENGTSTAASWVDLDITRQPVVAGAVPSLKTTPRVLRPVTASPGTWGPTPVKLTYQWLLDGKPIAGATKSTYAVRLKDVNRLLSVRVTGTKAGYQTTTLTSTGQRVRLL